MGSESPSEKPKNEQQPSQESPSDNSSALEKPADLETGSPNPPPPVFPDGGLRAWLTVLGGWMVLFCTFGMVNAFGVFQDWYLSEYIPEKTASDISWVGSVQVALQFASGMIVGKLFDEGYFHALILAGSVLWVFSFMMVSLCKDYYNIFLAQGIGLGLANGILFLPSIGVLSHYFRRKRALATGILVSGSSVGGIIFPIMLNKLFHSSTGFEWGVRAAGFVGLGCLVVANLTMRTRLPPRKHLPAHLQVKPDFKGILKDGPFLIAVLASFFSIMGIFYVLFYIQVFAQAHGLSRTISFYSLAITNAASVFGRVVPNFLADKYGSFNLLIPCTFCAAGLTFVMLACTNAGGVVVLSILYGFFSGAYVSLMPGAIAGFARGVHEIGVRLGITFLATSIGALLGTPISGWLLTDSFHWWRASLFSGLAMGIGCLLWTLSRHMVSKKKKTQVL